MRRLWANKKAGVVKIREDLLKIRRSEDQKRRKSQTQSQTGKTAKGRGNVTCNRYILFKSFYVWLIFDQY